MIHVYNFIDGFISIVFSEAFDIRKVVFNRVVVRWVNKMAKTIPLLPMLLSTHASEASCGSSHYQEQPRLRQTAVDINRFQATH